MLPRRNRAERRASARTTVKTICAQRRASEHPRLACVGTLDTFRAFSAAPLDAKQPLRAQPPAPLPAGHVSRQVRRAHARAMRAAVDAGTVAAPWGARGRVFVNGRDITVGS